MTRRNGTGSRRPGTSLLGEKSRQHELYSNPRCWSIISIFSMERLPKQGQPLDAVHRRGAGRVSRVEGLSEGSRGLPEKEEEFRKLPGVTTPMTDAFDTRPNLTPPRPRTARRADSDYGPQTPLKHLDLLLDGRTEDAVERGNGRQVFRDRAQAWFLAICSVQVQDRADDGEIDHHARDIHRRCQRRCGHHRRVQIDGARADRQQRAEHGGRKNLHDQREWTPRAARWRKPKSAPVPCCMWGRMKLMNAAIVKPRVSPREMPVRASFQAMRSALPVLISPSAIARMTMVAACPPELPPAATTIGRNSASTNAFSSTSLNRYIT